MLDQTNLILVLGAVAVGLVGLAAVGFLMQRRQRPQPRTEVDLDTAWGAWFGDAASWSERERAAVGRLQARGDAAAEALRKSIAATVDHVLAAPEPTVELRRAIMDAADDVVMADTLGGDAQAIDASDNVVTVGVLRRFAKLRFHDWARVDWFAHYRHVASMNAKNVATMVRKTVGGDVSAMESALHDPLVRTMRQVREKLLRYPPRAPVTRADELTQPDAKERLHPSQKQLDLLTSTMRKRFDKLFSGQVYNLPHAPPVDPVGAFHIDAGLLYALLASYFRYPKEAWRKIMVEALGPYKDAMRDDEALLNQATAVAEAWNGAADGALTAAMRSSWTLAFKPASASPSDAPIDETALVAGMVEQAGPLVGAIRDVIEKH